MSLLGGLRAWWERVRGKFYEGPDPPERLRTMVEEFALHNPHATRGDWMSFAAGHAEECYRSGYQRGFEALHRRLDVPALEASPGEGDEAHDWEWVGRPSSADLELAEPVRQNELPLELVEGLEADERARMGRAGRRV